MRPALDFWDREVTAATHVSWMADEDVRHYINRSISGNEHAWPFDWFQSRFPRRFERALSIGCGTGALERDLVRRDIAGVVDAFDGSVTSIDEARREATAAGLAGRIRYFVGDFNAIELPRDAYDAVFVHQALHHVAELENLYAAILRALHSDGVLYFDEYVGPSRFEWNPRLVAVQREVFATLPEECRAVSSLPLPIHKYDPSEGYRSSEIVPLLEVGFDVIERRDYGGNVLSVLFPSIDRTRAEPGLVRNLVRDLIGREERLLRGGVGSFYSIVVARPKKGTAKSEALAHYARAARRSRFRRGSRDRLHSVARFARRVPGGILRRSRRLVGALLRAAGRREAARPADGRPS